MGAVRKGQTFKLRAQDKRLHAPVIDFACDKGKIETFDELRIFVASRLVLDRRNHGLVLDELSEGWPMP